jgi:hypothetical protein
VICGVALASSSFRRHSWSPALGSRSQKASLIHSEPRYRTWVAQIVSALLAGVATASFLSLIETNVWWISFLDFPRVQISA